MSNLNDYLNTSNLLTMFIVLSDYFFLQIPVLFEETFFNANDESYMVLCIAHPLDGVSSGLYYGVTLLTNKVKLNDVCDIFVCSFHKLFS